MHRSSALQFLRPIVQLAPAMFRLVIDKYITFALGRPKGLRQKRPNA
jgi:hypothetical protein